MRLMTMICMLFVIVMLISRARDPQTWKAVLGGTGPQERVGREGSDQKQGSLQTAPAKVTAESAGHGARNDAVAELPADSEKKTAAVESADVTEKSSGTPEPNGPAALAPGPKKSAAAKIPTATGPTDEDDAEADASIEDFDYVFDKATSIHPEEHDAYERITRWVINQPFARLAARAMPKNPTWGALVTDPQEFRQPGKIYNFVVHLRMALKFDTKLPIRNEDDPHDPVTLYEMWGTTDESPSRLSYFLVYDPPAGLPLGKEVHEDVRFVGYFFRVQGYEPAGAALNSPLQLAPSFIGRIAWTPRQPGGVVSAAELPWLYILVGVVVLILALWLGYLLLGRRSRNVAYLATDLPPPPELQVENWLNRIEAGQQPDSDSNGHVESDGDEYGASYRDGYSNGHTET